MIFFTQVKSILSILDPICKKEIKYIFYFFAKQIKYAVNCQFVKEYSIKITSHR